MNTLNENLKYVNMILYWNSAEYKKWLSTLPSKTNDYNKFTT